MAGFQIPHASNLVLQVERPKMPVVNRRLIDTGCELPAIVDAAQARASELEALKNFPMRRLMLTVAEVTGVAAGPMCSQRRAHPLIKARQILMWMGHQYTTLSLPQIGRATGKRDHTTVLHSVRKVNRVFAHFNLVVMDSERQMIAALWDLDWSEVPRC